MTARTWQAEMVVVAVVLAAVAARSGSSLEWVGSLAVLLTFAHAQVSERLAEREGARQLVSVDCYRWARRYFIGKEALWFIYFACRGAWSALAGVAIFLVYPLWRAAWRRRFPLRAE